MKTQVFSYSLLGLFIFGAVQPSLVAAAPGQWQINPSKSAVTFSVKNLGFAVKGKFTKVTGTVNYDEKNLSNSSVEAAIDSGSISTGIEPRDHHLKGKDFFNIKEFPELQFKSSKIEVEPSGAFKIIGSLSMHGVSQPVVLDAKPIGGAKAGDDNKLHLSASASTKLRRKDFGIGGLPAATIGNDVNVQLQLDLARVSDAKAGAETQKAVKAAGIQQ